MQRQISFLSSIVQFVIAGSRWSSSPERSLRGAYRPSWPGQGDQGDVAISSNKNLQVTGDCFAWSRYGGRTPPTRPTL